MADEVERARRSLGAELVPYGAYESEPPADRGRASDRWTSDARRGSESLPAEARPGG